MSQANNLDLEDVDELMASKFTHARIKQGFF